MNRREAAVLGAYTGTLMGDFQVLHVYVEEKLGRPVMTHEMAFPETWEEIKKATRDDFLAICSNITSN